ncbi:MAG: DNA mismatch repair endonuclease MutL [Candidatus Heimdallarchaeota archaeon]|nr:DNA mismatch repair endonuclease MutL [Candidatus Heimdallarchaeota archaeon]
MKIQKLPAHIVARIAAGEVVERPANIVKELVENAIDAESTEIVITLDNAGLDKVVVRDNGLGINEEELETAFQLHTTSKIVSDDILSVSTLGFRGEALSSISAVSLVHCRSRTAQGEGYEIIIEGGKKVKFGKCNCQIGTEVSVTGLFFNTPARRKFLKTAATERKRISHLITSYCLMYPELHIKLEEKSGNGLITRLESPKRRGMMAVVFDVLGAEIAKNLLPIKGKIGTWQVDGVISKPILTRKDRSLQFICVNGRPIHHNSIQESIEKAYGSQLMRSSYPVLAINISGPVNGVDFNVHPQKSEVRFRSDDSIVQEIAILVEQSLEETWELPKLQKKKLGSIKTPDLVEKSINEKILSSNKQEPKKNILLQTSLREEIEPFELGTQLDSIKAEKKNKSSSDFLADRGVHVVQGMKVLGQVMKKFAVIDAGDELWMMDIHASDERVWFERYEARRNKKILEQQLLSPLEVCLIMSEKQIVLDHLDLLQKFGLGIIDSAGDKLLISSVPIFFNRKLTKEGIIDLLQEFIASLQHGEEGDVETIFNKEEYRVVANLACHGSIRSGYHVSNDKIAEVLDLLLKCNNPWTCAHGRPTILRVNKGNLENWFKR